MSLLQQLGGVIDIAALECSYFAEWLERDAFADMPQSIELAAGIVDEASYGIETPKKIRDRAADWARVVDRSVGDRLTGSHLAAYDG